MNTKALIRAREKAGLSQLELAEKVGATQSLVSHIERGFRQPSVELLKRMAVCLAVTTDYLLSDESEFFQNNGEPA